MPTLKELVDALGEDERAALSAGTQSDRTAEFLIDNVDEAELGDVGILLGEPAEISPSPLTSQEQQLESRIVGGVTTAPSTAARVATEAIPFATSVGGSLAGAVSPIPGGAFLGGVAGETAGQEILQAIGLQPERSVLGTAGEALALETAGTVAGNLAQVAARRFLPASVVNMARRFSGKTASEFTTEAQLRERIVGEGSEDVTQSLRELGLSPEAQLGLTTTQRTGGIAGAPVAAELATREREVRRTGAKGAFGRADEALRSELEDVITNGDVPRRFRGEDFTSSFNNIINTSQKEIRTNLRNRGNMQQSVINTSNQTVDFGANLRDAVDAFKVEITNFDPVEKERLFNEIKRVIPENTTNISLRDVDNIQARLRNLSGAFTESKQTQNEVAGIISRFRSSIIDPVLLSESRDKIDVARFMQNESAIRTLKQEQSALNNAKSVIKEGVTESLQERKATGSKQLLNTVFSSPESFRQFRDILETSGDVQLLDQVEDAFVGDILRTAVGSASELGLKGAKSLSSASLNRLIEDPTKASLIREVKGEDYFNNLQRVQNVLAARESSNILVGALGEAEQGAIEQGFGQLAARFGAARVTNHSLRAASSLLAIMDKTVQNIMGLRGSNEKQLLEYLSSPENAAQFDKLLDIQITDPKAFGLVQGVLRNATGRLITRDEFRSLGSLIEEGALDKIPQDGAAEDAQSQ